ncbi:SRPBCC family protein [Nonlabens antarcticus]|uniref:SRPBCC family protein n=1 Tax=Nonlabens antarcticus TaxID=392714 RepID=UPI001E346824|nr:SRPBCC family protein [Nonlabens antarcticus]
MRNKYQITIDRPIEELMTLFLNQDNFKHWQRGLISFENLTKEIGFPGSRRKLKIKTLVGTISMTEEITARDLPNHWSATYRTSGVVNFQENRFRESEITTASTTIKQTTWESTSEFKFTGMMRLVAKAKPDLFEKQTYLFMQDFKRFAEEGISATTL